MAGEQGGTQQGTERPDFSVEGEAEALEQRDEGGEGEAAWVH